MFKKEEGMSPIWQIFLVYILKRSHNLVCTGNAEELVLLHQKKHHATDGGHRYIAFLSERGF